MTVIRRPKKAEFLKESLSAHYGKLIMFDDASVALIVGDHEFKELNLSKYGEFVHRVVDLEERLAQAVKARDDCAALLQSARHKLDTIREAEEKRAKLTDPRVVNTIRYKVTRFAIRLKAASGVQETLDAIDHAVSQMTKFVQNFCDLPEDKAVYNLDDFDIET